MAGLLATGTVFADKAAEELREKAAILLQKDEFKESEKTLLKALNIELKKYGTKSSQAARSQLVQAKIMFFQGKYDSAINLAKSSLNILGNIHGSNSLEATEAGYVLAELFLRTGQIIEAEATIRRTLAIQLDKAPQSPATAAGRILLAEILSMKDRYKVALTELDKAAKVLKPDAPEMVQCQTIYSDVYRKQHKTIDAFKAGRSAVDLAIKLWGEKSLQSALAARCLVELFTAEKKFAEARKLLPAIATTVVKKVGTKHVYTIEMMILRGVVYMREGEVEKSKVLLNRATADIQHILPGKNLITALAMFYSAQLNSAMKQYPSAEIMFKYAHNTFLKQLGNDNLMLASCLNELALLAGRSHKYKSAVPFEEKALRIYTQIFGEDTPRLAPPLGNMAYMYTRAGQPDKAIAAYLKALQLYEKTSNKAYEVEIARTSANLAALYGRMKQQSKAKAYCEKALALCDKHKNLKNPKIATIYFLCSFYYYTTQDYKRAYELVSMAQNSLRRIYGPNYPAVKNYDQILLQIKQKMK